MEQFISMDCATYLLSGLILLFISFYLLKCSIQLGSQNTKKRNKISQSLPSNFKCQNNDANILFILPPFVLFLSAKTPLLILPTAEEDSLASNNNKRNEVRLGESLVPTSSSSINWFCSLLKRTTYRRALAPSVAEVLSVDLQFMLAKAMTIKNGSFLLHGAL